MLFHTSTNQFVSSLDCPQDLRHTLLPLDSIAHCHNQFIHSQSCIPTQNIWKCEWSSSSWWAGKSLELNIWDDLVFCSAAMFSKVVSFLSHKNWRGRDAIVNLSWRSLYKFHPVILGDCPCFGTVEKDIFCTDFKKVDLGCSRDVWLPFV